MARTPRPQATVPGQALLTSWLEAAGLTQRALARALALHKNTVHAWLKGTGRPSLEAGAVLERLSSGAVPLTAWADPGEVERLVSAAVTSMIEGSIPSLQKSDAVDLPPAVSQS